jgi:MinD-like ATPase involved in chromosome partitioning or flagellar assembly
VARKLSIPQLFLVINMALTSYDFGDLKSQVEETYESPVATILPLSEGVARLASADLFSLRHPDQPFSEGICQIVAAIEAAA